MEGHKTDSSRHIAGAMSGTSADGVDVAITRIEGRGLDMRATLVRHHHRPYNAALRSEIFAFRGDAGDVSSKNFLSRLAQLGREISLTYAAAVNEALSAANMTAADLAAVAAHGQTLFHDPPNTIQWFDPSLVAAEVGCPVVSDFRRADLAVGGQGAPLVPFADYILFRHPTKNRVLLNIGGIANLTWIPAGASIDQVIAFDTGPGNCISDHLCRKYDPSGIGYDTGGARALRGRLGKRNVEFVSQMVSDPYFARNPPKSTDGLEMISIFERVLGDAASTMPLDDLLAIACHLTGVTADAAIRALSETEPDDVIISGGGSKNQAIWSALDDGLPIQSIDNFGVPSDAKEAIAFALLGAATLDGVPSNVPSATGARRAVVLGSVTPKP